MHGGARLVAANRLLQSQPDSRKAPRDPYVSKYPHPDQEPVKTPAGRQQLRRPARTDNVARTVAIAAFIGLIASFAMHLVNLRMQNLGISGSLISLSVAVQAFAICATALVAKHVIARFGFRCTLPLSSVLCGVSLIAIFFNADVHTINVLRILFAVGLTFLLIASEYLVTILSNDDNRGRLIAWYATALGAGAIAGPFLVSVIGINESSSFFAGAAMLLFGSSALSNCLSEHEGKTWRRNSPFAAIAFMPAAFLAAFVFGIADNGGLSMLPVYGALNGYDNTSAANLAVFAAFGGLLLQFPVGWLATKRDTRELLAIFSVCILCLLALLPIVIANKVAALAVAVLLGGLIEGFYTIGLISISRDRRVESLSSLNACFISVCALGEVVGPAASSVSMHYFGPHGLVIALLVVFAGFALGMMNRLWSSRLHPLTFN